jgi:mono/diheme cytochrome c family protein/glucose/arabinose dehydrogenase
MIQKLFYSVLFITCILPGCQSDDIPDNTEWLKDSLAIREEFGESPVVSAEESLEKMQIEDGFAVQLVASEPLVNTPIAMTFDENGRIWVVEMQGYMPDTAGIGEGQPTGKIVILDDRNKDGVADERKVFLDSLVLPRAICFVENGVLIAEPPRLWFVELAGDRPGKKTLVDDKYAEGGNAEHQANGLIRGLDNWIYSANSRKRYKKHGNDWLIERTHFRGQWGISQDDYGRLFYNNNSANVLGDYFPPSLGATNKNQRRVSGFNEKIVPDNRVYPARATPGVNRGYMKGILDSTLRLVSFTAACGPVIYRGDLFGKEFEGNAFVAEPAANLIKRNILQEKGYFVNGKQAYTEKEFLASTDERFRPVSLYNGPDGSMYMVDMYRGIIQHKTYLTDYLKHEIKDRSLTEPLSYGRIYRIVSLNKESKMTTMPKDPLKLVRLYEHPNGWVRDKAQQMIIDGKYIQVVPVLRQYLSATDKPLTLIHALWTMEGLEALKPADILPLLQQTHWPIRMQALTLLSAVMTDTTYKEYLPVLQKLLREKDTLAVPIIAFLVNSIQSFDKAAADTLLNTIIQNYPGNKYVADAVITGLQDEEATFLKKLTVFKSDTSLAINKQLQKVIADIKNSMNDKNAKELEKKYPKGVGLFKATCQTCHGADGNGIQSLAPPLNKSEWVVGNKEKLSTIVLFGLTGPVEVSGKLYKAPEITGDMPGIGNNKDLSDEDIAQLLNFIRNSWGNKADEVKITDISRTRRKYAGRQTTFTMEELKKKR